MLQLLFDAVVGFLGDRDCLFGVSFDLVVENARVQLDAESQRVPEIEVRGICFVNRFFVAFFSVFCKLLIPNSTSTTCSLFR